MNAKGPTLAFSLPSRPRRKNSRIVAPSPPASTKPAPSAPAATIGRRARSLPVTSVASPRPARRSSAAAASWSRSLAIARRTSCGERVLARAIALQCLRGQTRLGNCLLRHRRHASLHSGQPDERENRRNEHEPAADGAPNGGQGLGSASRLWALAELRPARRDDVRAGLEVCPCLALRTGDDQAWLHPAEKHRVFGQRLRELRGQPA